MKAIPQLLQLISILVSGLVLIYSLHNILLKLDELTKKLPNYLAKKASNDQMKSAMSGQVNAENTVIVKHPHPSTEPGIMFLQSSSELNPSPLTICSIESAARLNPNKPVYYFMRGFNGKVSAYRDPEYKGIRLLSSFKNVITLPLNPKELFSNTPLAGWYEKVDPSTELYWIISLSDGCRIALLWKYGGTYLDTDIISIKPLLFHNFLCAELGNYANNAALGFNRSHSFIESCLWDFVENYNGAVWGQQGPELMTRMLKKWCETDNLHNVLNKECKGIKYLSNNWFYPVPYPDWKKYFEKDTWKGNADEIEKKFSETIGVHFWNSLSRRHKFQIKGSRSLIEYFFYKYCPSTYETLPK